MSKGLTLQNIWESKIPVENGSTFKFKSTVWRSTRIEGLIQPQIAVIKNERTCDYKGVVRFVSGPIPQWGICTWPWAMDKRRLPTTDHPVRVEARLT